MSQQNAPILSVENLHTYFRQDEGVVRAVDVDPDYTQRPEPEKTPAALAALA